MASALVTDKGWTLGQYLFLRRLYYGLVVEIVANHWQFSMLGPNRVIIPDISEAILLCITADGSIFPFWSMT